MLNYFYFYLCDSSALYLYYYNYYNSFNHFDCFNSFNYYARVKDIIVYYIKGSYSIIYF